MANEKNQKDTQTDNQTNTQTDIQTDNQTITQANAPVGAQTDAQIGAQTDTQTEAQAAAQTDNQNRLWGESSNSSSAPAAPEKIKTMGFLKRLIGIIGFPTKTMEDLAQKPRIFFGICLALLPMPILYLLRFPLYMATMRETLELALIQQGIPPEQLESVITISAYSGLIGVGVAPLVVALVTAFGIFVIAKILKGEGKFKQYFSVVGYAGVITALYICFTLVASYFTDSITLDISPAIFFSLEPTSILNVVLTSLGLFNIWYYIVLGIGVHAVGKFSKAKAVITTLIVFLISLAISIGSVLASTAVLPQ